MALTPGTHLGPYEILSQLGAGGMGEVYKARDIRLERIVAIKVLPAHLAGSSELRERFEREARTIANLKHPHICTLYDVGRDNGIDYLVMEYLEGESLAVRLLKGPLPLDQTLRYAIEISDALDTAHRQGFTHRDIKPGNIMLTPKDGSKLLDFGLAKLRQEAAPADIPLSQLPTMPPGKGRDNLTVHGTILGTLQYMAPEQLEGNVKELDARTDIFAFGATVYEMATGQRAFQGKSQVSLMAAILEHDPSPITSHQPLAPMALDHIVKRCFAKEPAERWQAASDICRELQWIKEGGGQLPAPTPAPVAPQKKIADRLAWPIAAIAIVFAALAAVLYLRRAPAEVRPIRFSVDPPEKTTFPTVPNFLTVSPDGTRLAFVATDSSGHPMLWVRGLDSLSAQALPGTNDANQPFWSDDSRFIAFYAQGKLKKIDVSGGPAQTLTDASQGRSGTWNRNGVILFTPKDGPIYRVSSAGGAATPATTFDTSRQQNVHYWPQFLPDGKHFLYYAPSSNPEKDAIYVGLLDSKETKLLLNERSIALYSPPGYLLFHRDGTLMAQPFDANRIELTGDAFPIAEGLQFNPAQGRAAFGVSETGVLVYRVGGSFTGQFAWMDRAGKELARFGETAGGRLAPHFAPSPDEKRVAMDMATPQGRDLWLLDIIRGTTSRFALGILSPGLVWSSDGNSLTYVASRAGAAGMYQKLSSGAGQDELLLDEAGGEPNDRSQDGRFLLYQKIDPKTKSDLWVLPLSGDRKPRPFLQSEFNEAQGQFSPDGRWVAYTSDESGRSEVYVQPFPGPGPKAQISTAGGILPKWRGDGKELFYVAAGILMSVEVKPGVQFEASVPRLLFDAQVATGHGLIAGNDYAVAADGKRFLVIKAKEETAAAPITVVVNWTAGLKK